MGEDYNEHWKDITVKDKVVLDLGCDSGSTAKFFLDKGAKIVWGVEIVSSCAQMSLDRNLANFFYIQGNINNKDKIEQLLTTIRPDTVKVDIEGAERWLLITNPDILKIPNEWYIEGHTIYLFKALSSMFKELGYEVIDRFPIPECPDNRRRELRDEQYITVFICRRKI